MYYIRPTKNNPDDGTLLHAPRGENNAPFSHTRGKPIAFSKGGSIRAYTPQRAPAWKAFGTMETKRSTVTPAMAVLLGA